MFQRKGKMHAASPFDGPEKIDTFKLARLFEECGEELGAMHRSIWSRLRITFVIITSPERNSRPPRSWVCEPVIARPDGDGIITI